MPNPAGLPDNIDGIRAMLANQPDASMALMINRVINVQVQSGHLRLEDPLTVESLTRIRQLVEQAHALGGSFGNLEDAQALVDETLLRAFSSRTPNRTLSPSDAALNWLDVIIGELESPKE